MADFKNRNNIRFKPIFSLILETNLSAETLTRDDFRDIFRPKDNELSGTNDEALCRVRSGQWPPIMYCARYRGTPGVGMRGHVFTTMTTLDMVCILQQHLGVRMLITSASVTVLQ